MDVPAWRWRPILPRRAPGVDYLAGHFSRIPPASSRAPRVRPEAGPRTGSGEATQRAALWPGLLRRARNDGAGRGWLDGSECHAFLRPLHAIGTLASMSRSFMLPPRMFSEEEIEALVLGSRWVARQGDERRGARRARQDRRRLAARLRREPRCLRPPRRRRPCGERGRGDRPRPRAPGDPARAQAQDRLSEPQRRRLGTRHLAVRPRLLRARPHDRGVVRAAPGFPPFPHRPDRRTPGPRPALHFRLRAFVSLWFKSIRRTFTSPHRPPASPARQTVPARRRGRGCAGSRGRARSAG